MAFLEEVRKYPETAAMSSASSENASFADCTLDSSSWMPNCEALKNKLIVCRVREVISNGSLVKGYAPHYSFC